MTSSYEISNNIEYLIELYRKKRFEKNRILHFTNKGYTTWYKVAKVVKNEIESILEKKLSAKIKPIKYKEWNAIANRPLDSRLKVNFHKLENNNIFLPDWESSVRRDVGILLPIIIEDLKNE